MDKTQTHTPAGEYRPTEIDAQKARADYRIVGITGPYRIIYWADGRVQTTKGQREFRKATAGYTGTTDF